MYFYVFQKQKKKKKPRAIIKVQITILTKYRCQTLTATTESSYINNGVLTRRVKHRGYREVPTYHFSVLYYSLKSLLTIIENRFLRFFLFTTRTNLLRRNWSGGNGSTIPRVGRYEEQIARATSTTHRSKPTNSSDHRRGTTRVIIKIRFVVHTRKTQRNYIIKIIYNTRAYFTRTSGPSGFHCEVPLTAVI